MGNGAYDLAVVGGGISGLSYAYFAAKAGLGVALIERGSLGGKIRSLNFEGTVTEAGPEEIVDGPAIRRIISELGLSERVVRPSSSTFYLLYDGMKLVEVPEGVAAGVPKPSLGLLRMFLKGPLRLADLVRALAEPAKRLNVSGDVSGYELLKELFGDGITSRLFETIIGNIYGGSLRDMSSEVYFPYILGLKRRGKSVLLHYMRGMPGLGLISFRDGVSELVNALVNEVSRLGASLIRGEAVRATKEGDVFRVLTSAGEVRARRLALAVPAPEAARIAPEGSEAFSAISHMIRRTKVSVVNLAYEKGSLKDSRSSGFLSSNPMFGLSGCTFINNKWNRRGGACVVRCFFPYQYFMPEERWLVQRASEILNEAGLVDGRPYAYIISNFPDAIPIYRPGFKGSLGAYASLPQGIIALGELVGATGIYSSVSYALTRMQAGSEPSGSPK